MKEKTKKTSITRKTIDTINLCLTAIAALALFTVMVTMTVDGLARKFFGSIPGAFYLSIGFMVLILFLPQGYAQKKKAHVAIDILSERFPPKIQAILGCISAILGIFVFGILTWASWIKAWEATQFFQSWIGIIDFPSWPFRWAIPIGCALLSVQFLVTAIDEFRKFKGEAK